MRCLLTALVVQGALAGTCADSATLDYPAGLTGLERGSFAPPYEELGGSASTVSRVTAKSAKSAATAKSLVPPSTIAEDE